MTDSELIKKVQKGVTGCFSQLVARYQVRLYSYLLARCHNPFDADDVLQETFINAYQYLNSYNPKWAFSTWLFTIARRLLQQLDKTYFIPVDTVQLTSNENTATLEIEQDNIWRLIKKHVAADCYDALWLYYKEDADIKNVAFILNKSQSWVKTNLHRSKIKLREIFELRHLMETL